MRILQIAPPWFAVPPVGYGGTEWVVAQLTDGLVAAGHDVTLYASGGSQTQAELRSPFRKAPSTRLGDQWVDLMHVVAAYRDARDYDVVHDHSGIIGPSLGAMLGSYGVLPPLVHTLHGPWHEDAIELYAQLPSGAQGGLHLVAISQDQASRAPDGVTIDAVVHNSVPFAQYEFRADQRDGTGPLGFVGRAHPDKGVATAMRVAHALRRPLKMAVKVNEPEEQAYYDEVLRPLLRGADIELHINATAEQKLAVLRDADALLMPLAWHEPFGMVMAEAMACGTPVVAYNMGAAAEVVADGRTGFLVEPGDFTGLCAAVAEVDRIDPQACRQRVETLFSETAMVEGYVRVYEKVCSRVRKSPNATYAGASAGE